MGSFDLLVNILALGRNYPGEGIPAHTEPINIDVIDTFLDYYPLQPT